MATPSSTEAIEVRRKGRQRLIGAVAIVLLLVVFVPMLLDSEPRPARNEPALAIPTKENAPPLPAPVPARPATSPAPEAAPAMKPAEAKVLSPAAEPPKTARVTPEAAPKAVAAAPRLEGFAVQVGAFRDEEKLKQSREKLVSAGIAHYTERLDTSTGELTRLRAGPYASREAAEAGVVKLRGLALDGKVVPLP
jgi:DedD protein